LMFRSHVVTSSRNAAAGSGGFSFAMVVSFF
jgi:hypothetical protein